MIFLDNYIRFFLLRLIIFLNYFNIFIIFPDSNFGWIINYFENGGLFTLDWCILLFIINFYSNNFLFQFRFLYWWICKWLLRSVGFDSNWFVRNIGLWFFVINWFCLNCFVQRFFNNYFCWNFIIYYRLLFNFRNIWVDFFRF